MLCNLTPYYSQVLAHIPHHKACYLFSLRHNDIRKTCLNFGKEVAMETISSPEGEVPVTTVETVITTNSEDGEEVC